jgi:hypothetical protein
MIQTFKRKFIMAIQTKTHGDYQPVMNYDSREYTVGSLNAVTSAVTVQPQGPKLDFFTVTATGALTGAQVNTIVQTLQQLAVVYLYEYTDTTNDTLAVAVYPTAAWTTGAIDTAIAAAGISGTTTTASATFTN